MGTTPLVNCLSGKHVICFSGGEGSAVAAVEVFRRFGSENLILLNHDITDRVEDTDVKRFKREVAEFCGVSVTYANHPEWQQKDQFDVVVEAGAFKVGTGTALCTNRLKTAPFMRWIDKHKPDGSCIFYYGFSTAERDRVQRRSSIMAAMGHQTGFPLWWHQRTIHSITEIGVQAPLTYSVFKHANCVGCLKAGMQHWYIVYCTRKDIWAKALWSEEMIDYSIIKGHWLHELEPKFAAMQRLGIEATERIPAATFWAKAKKILAADEESKLPCECAA